MELDREARKHAERQKQRVLEELCAMEGEHHIKIKQVLSRPKSSSEVYESKSKSSKYDHLTNPSREKSKFHDRCDDTDFRPEKQAWVPEEIRTGGISRHGRRSFSSMYFYTQYCIMLTQLLSHDALFSHSICSSIYSYALILLFSFFSFYIHCSVCECRSFALLFAFTFL